jgi:hypothetical protein
MVPSRSLTFSTEISIAKSFSKIFLVMQKVSWMSILLIYCKLRFSCSKSIPTVIAILT